MCVSLIALLPSLLNRPTYSLPGFNTYYDWLRAHYLKKREILAEGLSKAGIKPYVCVHISATLCHFGWLCYVANCSLFFVSSNCFPNRSSPAPARPHTDPGGVILHRWRHQQCEGESTLTL